MNKNTFAQDYAAYQTIAQRYEAAKAQNDEAGKTAARAEYKAWGEAVDAKGEGYANIYRLYAEAQERGNEFIDLHDTIWDKNVPVLIASLREHGIEKFTFSSTWSSAVETAWLFTKEGCKLEGLVEINSQHKDIFTGEREKAHGYLFSL